MRLHEYVNEIFDIAEKNRVNVSTGTTMFLTNCDRGDDYYEGAEGCHFGLLKDANAGSELRTSIFPFYKAVNAIKEQIDSLRAEEKYDEAQELIMNYN